MRKQLTTEQQAARDARKERFAGFVKTVSAMTDDQKAALVAQMGTVVNCEGHPLSVRNTLLIALQGRGNATVVGGFRQWLNQGRCVRKGEHGVSILFPRTPGKKDEEPGAGPREGEIQLNAPRIMFLTGTVFDVSQTEAIATEQEAA